MALKVLCVGDMHLGKVVTRLPAALEDFGISAQTLSPAATWRRTWERAIEEQVDAVLLAGDVVEDENERFAALHHLDVGIRALVEHDIQVLAVAGNHDGTALPRLARQLEGLRLLGEGGRWETFKGTSRDGSAFEVLGWSFPDREYPENPFDQLDLTAAPNGLRIGLLHADLNGGAGSRYAPVASADFGRGQCDAWCMGHIHKPSPLHEAPHIGYLGSVIGLDPGEPGLHGPWLLSWDSAQGLRMRQMGLATVRWESLSLDVSAIPDALEGDDLVDAVQSALHAAADDTMAEWAANDTPLVVGCRLHVAGRSNQHRHVVDAIHRLREQPWQVRDVVFFIEAVKDGAGPALDLEAMARMRTPPGRLARQILTLQQGGVEAEGLLNSARESLMSLGTRAQWREASRTRVLDDDELTHRLTANATHLLETMLAQKELTEH